MEQNNSGRDRRGKFVEIATRRVNRTIREIRLISNLSNTAAYEYTQEDVRKILRALQKEIDLMRTRFEGTGKGADSSFTL